MMPLRVATPNRVINPMSDATDSTPPARNTPMTPPIKRQWQIEHDDQCVREGTEGRGQHQQNADHDSSAQQQQPAARPAPHSRIVLRTRHGNLAAGRPVVRDCRLEYHSRRRARSRPATLHCTTILRWTPSRLMKFGPRSSWTSATAVQRHFGVPKANREASARSPQVSRLVSGVPHHQRETDLPFQDPVHLACRQMPSGSSRPPRPRAIHNEPQPSGRPSRARSGCRSVARWQDQPRQVLRPWRLRPAGQSAQMC